jgi:hypothetical protein
MHGESFAYSSYTSVLSHLKNAGHDIASENTIYKRKCMHIDHARNVELCKGGPATR